MASISKRDSGAWQNTSYGIRATATDTITTLPTTIYGDGTNATVSVYGNAIQNGTPTPGNPIMPQWCGERTENLAYGRIDDANIDATGTIGRMSGFDIAIGRVESGVTYTANTYVFAFYTNEPTIGSVSYDGSRIVKTLGEPSTFTAPITGYVAFRLNTGEPAMLNTGSTALPYENFGYKIPILSNGATTPVYLGEVETTRQVKKLVLDGTENFTLASTDTNRTVCQMSLRGCKGNYGFCTHIIWKSSYQSSEYNRLVWTTTSGGTLFISLSNEYLESQTAAGFKSYLAAQYAAGTPVTVWYVLAESETAVVNEPLMRIDDYADEVSGVSIPTTDGVNTLSVDTTVQPSEVSVNYHGWHMGTVHERVSGEWD